MSHVAQAVALCSLMKLAADGWHARGRDPEEAVRLAASLAGGMGAAADGEAAALDGLQIAAGDVEDAAARVRAHVAFLSRRDEPVTAKSPAG